MLERQEAIEMCLLKSYSCEKIFPKSPNSASSKVVSKLKVIIGCLSLVLISAVYVVAMGVPTVSSPTPTPTQTKETLASKPETLREEQATAAAGEIKNQKPVIGILTEVLRDYKRFTDTKHLHLAASYVKWIEAAGGQVLPVQLNKDDDYYESIFKQTNGLLFPGGDNLLDPQKNTPMMVAARKLYKLAVEANDRGDFYPIWGTCLGLELLTVLTANVNTLEECSANDIPLAIEFKQRGKLFAPADYCNLNLGVDYSGLMMRTMSDKNVTYNYHHKCITDRSLKLAGLEQFYKPLAYSKDKNGLQFVAIMEANKYPFYGVQFHPEKPPFEFVRRKGTLNVPHSREAIAVSRFFGDFFVYQAQLNGHKADSKANLAKHLIYAYNANYTALKHDIYEQRYLFPFVDREAISSEEFIDHVPAEGEEIPEHVTPPIVVIAPPIGSVAGQFKQSQESLSQHNTSAYECPGCEPTILH